MIDLIIPYYNNPEGLERTLASIDHNIFYVTIIDDHSDKIPVNPTADQVFRYNQNEGPGYARQWGIMKTSNPYIMFIDAGDTFVSWEVQQTILETVEDNPEENVIQFSYYYNGEVTKETDNRMHGKIYKREFIEKYRITFPCGTSWMNEDIGFNRTCRLCTKTENKPFLFIDIPVINWIKEENSLTQKDNQEMLYKWQTWSLSVASAYCIDMCRLNGVDVEEEIHEIAVALYYWFIRIVAERPKYMEDAWCGASLFYLHYKKEINPNKLLVGNAYIKKCIKYRNKIPFPINILRFAHDIYLEEIPKIYYGGDTNEEVCKADC